MSSLVIDVNSSAIQEIVNWVTTADGRVHSADMTQLDSCRPIGIGPTDKLQRVLNVAAFVVIDMRKFDRSLSLLHDEIYWSDVPEGGVTYKLEVVVYCCLHGQAPRYLADHLITASDVASRFRLRSANRHQLIVPRCRVSTNTYGRRAFSIAGPTV